MDYIDKYFAADSSYEPAIRSALGIAKKTLKRYYNMTEVYRIAMGMLQLTPKNSLRQLTSKTVLHPRHKLAYFKSAKWEPERIESTEKIVREVYERSYASRAATNHDDEVEELPGGPLVSTKILV
jgi:hypothetical protein